jgi:hypothetical protein
MENALPLFGLAALLGGVGLVIHAVGYWWLRVKQLERAHPPQIGSAALAPAIDARLARIEAAVDAIAIEVERVGEAYRFVARLQDGSEAPTALVSPTDDAQHRDRP